MCRSMSSPIRDAMETSCAPSSWASMVSEVIMLELTGDLQRVGVVSHTWPASLRARRLNSVTRLAMCLCVCVLSVDNVLTMMCSSSRASNA